MDAMTTSANRETGSGNDRSDEPPARPENEGRENWDWFGKQTEDAEPVFEHLADSYDFGIPTAPPETIRPVAARRDPYENVATDSYGTERPNPPLDGRRPDTVPPQRGPETASRPSQAPGSHGAAGDEIFWFDGPPEPAAAPRPEWAGWSDPQAERPAHEQPAFTSHDWYEEHGVPPHTGPARHTDVHAVYSAAGEDTASDAALIRRTMAVVEPDAEKMTSYFYALLFLQYPQLRELFPAAMDAQRDRLFKALLTAANHIDDPGTLHDYLVRLGRGHRKYGTRPEHYPCLGECLIGALTRYASEIWNDEVEGAWVRAYTVISQTMIDAAAEEELVAPPWWEAEIVSHEMRTNDVAEITVRPGHPYPFMAGQYASLETPWWPRVWRQYSFASAPRSDGLLSFHVKIVPAGWVSSAIAYRARPGDVIRLGAPVGAMTVDHRSGDGMLCVGGGTGIAPIRAMVEEVVQHGGGREVEVFYAARCRRDLYDLDTLREMEQRYRWLSVRPVVSESRATGGGLVAGRVPDLVAQCGPWPAYDAYLSGPPGMISSSVDALAGVGMPLSRIRHDSLEELVAARD